MKATLDRLRRALDSQVEAPNSLATITAEAVVKLLEAELERERVLHGRPPERGRAR